MKKLIPVLCLLMAVSLSVSAQVVERKNISVTYEGMTVVTMACVDTDKLLPENSKSLYSDFYIDGARIEISSKKAADILYTENGLAFSTKAYRSKTLHFVVSKEGYETLEQDLEISSLSPSLYIFLTKKQED